MSTLAQTLMSPQRPGGGGRAVSAQKERESGAEVVEAVGARRVEQGAAGLDVEQSATESEEGVRDDAQYLGERERVHVQRTEQDAGDDNSYPGRRETLDEPNEKLAESAKRWRLPLLDHDRVGVLLGDPGGFGVVDLLHRLADTDHLKAEGVRDQAFCGCAAATRMSR